MHTVDLFCFEAFPSHAQRCRKSKIASYSKDGIQEILCSIEEQRVTSVNAAIQRLSEFWTSQGAKGRRKRKANDIEKLLCRSPIHEVICF